MPRYSRTDTELSPFTHDAPLSDGVFFFNNRPVLSAFDEVVGVGEQLLTAHVIEPTERIDEFALGGSELRINFAS